ncbi:mechanosensitive ion channel family protein [Gallibacterium genomosp. 1]|uniref:Small-conductance mechanosensitive channel n=1 Tax=Gallibacterium genomosp. 1 TaxID=155515 RepID=A0AB36DVX8_9PAST|nr:mechanosensitive ion channel domain-containing protein [Gallibacterium genomosp. 1]OBW99870.1 mechanosensitive ion channel protein MscS [Gallibacterium genomosp. 1]OBX00992.1 mechanosensitive ion channel protein MscS [Gallibacterium genomosp. 1]
MSQNTEHVNNQVSNALDLQNVDWHSLLDERHLLNIFNGWIVPYSIKILLAIVIFLVGKRLAKFISKLLATMILRTVKDEMLSEFIRSIAYFALLLIVVIASLSQLGINTTSLVALIGAAGLAIGLSLQNSLQNFAAGVMILIFKPFRKGDFIEVASGSGTVTQIGLLMLELRTGDNKTVLVPNNQIFTQKITNYSLNSTRRIDFIFDISYESDITKAKEIIARCLQEEPRVLKEPAPLIAVGALAASSVQLFVRPWVKTADYWGVHFDIMEKVKLEFDEAGIDIPFNQLDINFPEKAVEIIKQNSENK